VEKKAGATIYLGRWMENGKSLERELILIEMGKRYEIFFKWQD
jgi:hypothetical protein